MRKFIIFGVFILLPFYAHATVCSINTNYTSRCTPGCEFSAGDCTECNSGYYNNGSLQNCQQCPQNYENTWPDANGNPNTSGLNGRDPNKTHILGEYDPACSNWTCLSGYFANTNDGTCDSCQHPSNAHCVQGSSNWICDPNFYQNTNQCDPCPTNSETSGAGATSINQCTCNSNNFKYYDRSNSWIYLAGCMAAPSVNNNGWVLTNVNSESVYKCATHATLNGTGTPNPTCTCPNDSSLSGNDCVCNIGYHWTGTTDNFSCTQCPPNSSPVNGTCKCNAGYYGDANVAVANDSCKQCPDGTKTDNNNSNARSITDCYMDNTTMFCDGSGYCNTLIRSGYKIKYIDITQQ